MDRHEIVSDLLLFADFRLPDYSLIKKLIRNLPSYSLLTAEDKEDLLQSGFIAMNELIHSYLELHGEPNDLLAFQKQIRGGLYSRLLRQANRLVSIDNTHGAYYLHSLFENVYSELAEFYEYELDDHELAICWMCFQRLGEYPSYNLLLILNKYISPRLTVVQRNELIKILEESYPGVRTRLNKTSSGQSYKYRFSTYCRMIIDTIRTVRGLIEVTLVDEVEDYEENYCETTEEMVFEKMLQERLITILMSLSNDKQRDALIYRFGLCDEDQLTLIQTACKIGGGKSNVSRLVKQAIDNMKKPYHRGGLLPE